jgi:uncharacterized protein YdcH (DUF465 family)
MERRERDQIELLMKEDAALRRLYQEHLVLDEEVARIERKTFLTPMEQSELKRLKHRKLAGVDKMMSIVQPQFEDEDREVLAPTGT